MSIIQSLLDNDLYKFSMQQAVLHHFSDAIVEYKFKCRNDDVKFNFAQFHSINYNIQILSSLAFNESELKYLESIYFLKPDYIDFLRGFRLQPKCVHPEFNPNTGEIKINIEGPWLQTILFEVPVLAIINETYFNSTETTTSQKISHNPEWIQTSQNLIKIKNEMEIGFEKLNKKFNILDGCRDGIKNGFKFADFGTRRRFSFDWQATVIHQLVTRSVNFIGTSNVYFAMKYGIKPIGTMAHEWIQAGQAFVHPANSQKFMLQKWVDEYRGDLGIALGDTLGADVFFRDFDNYFAKLYDGVRQDSGDPVKFGWSTIRHYEKLNIDPKTKTIVFSNNLDIQQAIALYNIFEKEIKISFGIGTNLMNDLVRPPLNIVIKMTKCNNLPVAKISDDLTKGMCEDSLYLKHLTKVLKIDGE